MEKKIQIAIVEDDPYFNRLLEMYVREICSPELFPAFEFEVRSYISAHDFIAHIEQAIDILILDYYLYDASAEEQMDGYQILSFLKPKQPSCKVILLSSLSDSDILDGIRRAGIHAHVDKNFHTTSRVGMILQETMNNYAASA